MQASLAVVSTVVVLHAALAGAAVARAQENTPDLPQERNVTPASPEDVPTQHGLPQGTRPAQPRPSIAPPMESESPQAAPSPAQPAPAPTTSSPGEPQTPAPSETAPEESSEPQTSVSPGAAPQTEQRQAPDLRRAPSQALPAQPEGATQGQGRTSMQPASGDNPLSPSAAPPEAETSRPPSGVGFKPGPQVSVGAGTGFNSTYQFGVEARAGYSLPVGVYLGADLQGYWGNSTDRNQAHANMFGGEVGYEWYPIEELEVRPYMFLGPAFVTEVHPDGTAHSFTNLGFQPGALGMVHFGQGFAGADVRLMAAPAPFSAAVMGTAGVGF